jgi:hypothetical protein
LATLHELRMPQPGQPVPKGPQAVEVPRYRVIVEVALRDRPEPFARVRHRSVPAPAEVLLDGLQLRSQAFGGRPASHDEGPVPVLPADMREAQKIERLGLAFSSLFPALFGITPELDPARLVRVQFQPKLLSQAAPGRNELTTAEAKPLRGLRPSCVRSKQSWFTDITGKEQKKKLADLASGTVKAF